LRAGGPKSLSYPFLAVLRILQAIEIASNFRRILVHAKDENAKRFYERFDFVPSPSDPLHMMVLLKDLRKARDTVRAYIALLIGVK
jgi:hypothetical protein